MKPETIFERTYDKIVIRQYENAGKKEEHNERPLYRVFSKKNKNQIALISKNKSWNRYVMQTGEGYMFDKEMLLDLFTFMHEELRFGGPVPFDDPEEEESPLKVVSNKKKKK